MPSERTVTRRSPPRHRMVNLQRCPARARREALHVSSHGRCMSRAPDGCQCALPHFLTGTTDRSTPTTWAQTGPARFARPRAHPRLDAGGPQYDRFERPHGVGGKAYHCVSISRGRKPDGSVYSEPRPRLLRAEIDARPSPKRCHREIETSKSTRPTTVRTSHQTGVSYER